MTDRTAGTLPIRAPGPGITRRVLWRIAQTARRIGQADKTTHIAPGTGSSDAATRTHLLLLGANVRR